jgi:hypothetical protein
VWWQILHVAEETSDLRRRPVPTLGGTSLGHLRGLDAVVDEAQVAEGLVVQIVARVIVHFDVNPVLFLDLFQQTPKCRNGIA